MVREYTITYKNNNFNEEYFDNKKDMLDFLKENRVTSKMAKNQISQIFYKDYFPNGEEKWAKILFDKNMGIDLINFPETRMN